MTPPPAPGPALADPATRPAPVENGPMTAAPETAALAPRAVTLAIVALALGGFGIGVTEFASMGLLPTIAGSLGISEPTAGHLISAYALGVVVGAPLLAVLGARVSRRALLIALMALFAAGHVAGALAPDLTTLTIARFVSGLPHGAYFGVAAVVAASLVPAARRGRAIAAVMLGLTVANIIGVPVATAIGQAWGWRAAFWLVAGLGVATMIGIRLVVPAVRRDATASMTQELTALSRLQVWLTLTAGVVGFGGIFAVYTYITSTLTESAGLSLGWVPLVLALFGVGMTLGTVIGGRLADWSVPRTIVLGMAAVAVVMVVFTVAARHPVTAAGGVFLLGFATASTMPAMQARLMDVADGAQSLAASLSHAAGNLGNALGAWLGGVVIAAGLGYTSLGWVGGALAVAGLVVMVVAFALDRTTRPRRSVVLARGRAVLGARSATGGAADESTSR